MCNMGNSFNRFSRFHFGTKTEEKKKVPILKEWNCGKSFGINASRETGGISEMNTAKVLSWIEIDILNNKSNKASVH